MTNMTLDKMTVTVNDLGENKLEFVFRQKMEEGVKFNPSEHQIYGNWKLDIAELSEEIKHQAMVHGIKQKMSDVLANRKKLTLGEGTKNLTDLWEQLKEGTWAKKKRAASESGVKLSDLEKQFLLAVENGGMTWESANDLHKKLTGKDLPKIETTEEEI